MIINAYANVKNCLIKVYAIKDMLGIPVIVSVNVINHAMLVSIQIMKIVNVEKGWQINQQRNVMKILKKQVQLKLIRQSANIILAYCTLLFSLFFTINVGIGAYFVYYKYMNRNKENVSKYDYVYQAKNY